MEMALLGHILATTYSEITGIKVHFADPHSSWQRGINENTNGLLEELGVRMEDV